MNKLFKYSALRLGTIGGWLFDILWFMVGCGIVIISAPLWLSVAIIGWIISKFTGLKINEL